MTVKLKTKHPVKETVYQEAVLPAESADNGAIRISATALSAIVRHAACEVEGVTRITGNSIVDNIAEIVGSKKIQDRSIQILIRKNSVSVDLSINIRYGVSLPTVAAEVQEQIADRIGELTGIDVDSVNVTIREIEETIPEQEEIEEE